MILTFLSLMDILAASFVLLHLKIVPLVLLLALFIFLKSLFSLLSSMAHNSYTDWMGAIDFLAAVGMFVFILADTNSFVRTTAVLLLIKGVYSFILSRGA